VVLWFALPTALSIAMDLALRPCSLFAFAPKEWLNYFGSSLASAGFWSGPLWIFSRLFTKSSIAARVGIGLFGALFVLPLSFFVYGGQALYFQVFHAYMARDTVRLGIALRGTLGAWLASWGASLVVMALVGMMLALVILAAARRASMPVTRAWPVVPVLGFVVAAYCFWIDFVESRSLQAAPPDTCFIHGVVHAIHDGVTGKGWVRRGISLREPAPLPPLVPPALRRNVVLVITESVRADALCSAPSLGCKARFLDEVAPDRISLGKVTQQSSGTFTSCAMMWTGLAPDADFATFHHAPVLWEVARALGYRTAYLGAQNLRYEDLAAFLERAGIDVLAGAADLGDASDPHLGAPDENATARALAFVRSVPPGTPYFVVVHLSNTHWPYRVDPALQPFEPHADSILDTSKLFNHYRNSVLFQERTVASFVRELRAMPGWDDTALIFVSDHGEEFREHGGLYHLTSLYDEQLRVPGFLLAGPRVLDSAQRVCLETYAMRRVYSQDLHATVLDVLGAYDQRSAFPFADRVTGRSLLREPHDEPMVALSTASGVWGEPDDPKIGVMQGDLLAVRSVKTGWLCYDAARHARQQVTEPLARCAPLMEFGDRRFAEWK
jgi:glucan phosphoethanolaminetransferase (alkaline phosphatase superfamily)